VAVRHKQWPQEEKIIVIQLPNSTNLYLRSAEPGAITGFFEVSHDPKAYFTLYPQLMHTLNNNEVWSREVFVFFLTIKLKKKKKPNLQVKYSKVYKFQTEIFYQLEQELADYITSLLTRQ
jgi:hypothetical protein